MSLFGGVAGRSSLRSNKSEKVTFKRSPASRSHGNNGNRDSSHNYNQTRSLHSSTFSFTSSSISHKSKPDSFRKNIVLSNRTTDNLSQYRQQTTSKLSDGFQNRLERMATRFSLHSLAFQPISSGDSVFDEMNKRTHQDQIFEPIFLFSSFFHLKLGRPQQIEDLQKNYFIYKHEDVFRIVHNKDCVFHGFDLLKDSYIYAFFEMVTLISLHVLFALDMHNSIHISQVANVVSYIIICLLVFGLRCAWCARQLLEPFVYNNISTFLTTLSFSITYCVVSKTLWGVGICFLIFASFMSFSSACRSVSRPSLLITIFSWYIWLLVEIVHGKFSQMKDVLILGQLTISLNVFLFFLCTLQLVTCVNTFTQLIISPDYNPFLNSCKYSISERMATKIINTINPKQEKLEVIEQGDILRRYSSEQSQKFNLILLKENVIKKTKELHHWDIDEADLIIDRRDILGRGQYGTVYSCKYKNKICAVKVLDESKYSEDNILAFANEARLLIEIQHRNILRFIGCQFCAKIVCVLTEKCENYSLSHCIQNDTLNLSLNNELLRMMGSLSHSLHFLHTKQNPIIHCDLKPDNILVRDDLSVALADFGESITCNQNTEYEYTHFAGTPYYVSPEVILQEDVTRKSDIFSFGMILFEVSLFYHHRARFTCGFCSLKNMDTINPMHTRNITPMQICFHNGERIQMTSMSNSMNRIARGKRPILPGPFTRTWPEVAKLIQSCWAHKPDERPSALEVMLSLRNIIENAKGDEDDYLGLKTYPLRNYCFRLIMKQLRYFQLSLFLLIILCSLFLFVF